MNEKEIEQARRALLGDDDEKVGVAQANRAITRTKPEQIVITDSDLYPLKRAGFTTQQAESIRQYIKHIAARHPSALLSVAAAKEYADKLLDWAKEYAIGAGSVNGSDMNKAYKHVMRWL